MNALDMARLQFAATTGIHWLFVILTLGLVPLVAIMHTGAAISRNADRSALLERMTRFWGQLYVINYALGIVTGLVMEFQFGLSWSGLSKFAGNVFGAPLALETLIAFFAESTFLGMWIFGWGRLRKGLHVTLIWLVALTAYASAYWILVANGFMQNPVGYEVRGGVAYLTDFAAMLVNPSALLALGHITAAALLTGGLFVAGVSAYHFAKRTTERDFFRRSLRLGVTVAALVSYPVYLVGALQYPQLGQTQPMKMAALEGGSGVTELAARMTARHGPGNYIPPAWMTIGQNVMLYLGYIMAVIAIAAVLVVHRDRLVRHRWLAVLLAPAVAFPVSKFVGAFIFYEPGPYQGVIYALCVAVVAGLLMFGNRLQRTYSLGYVMAALIPLPFIASVGGWLFREVGRQPWIVYGELTIDQAVSPVAPGAILASLLAFTGVLAALAVTNWVLIARFARRGPTATQLGAGVSEPTPVEQPAPTF